MSNLLTIHKRQFCQSVLAVSLALSTSTQVYAQEAAKNTDDHDKDIIGYITQWEPWKDTKAGFVAKGAANHLNVDMSQYTVLNFSFFGVAVDGSLHSGDFRNKNIYKQGTVQQPAELLMGDVYSSWDYFLIFGELLPSYSLTAEAEEQGFVLDGSGWKNTVYGTKGSMPIPVKKSGGAPGLIEKAHANGVKVMASIGGWSMCRHFPEMAADPTKRAKFMEGVDQLMALGFDGIDLDWEYPGPYSGMNFIGSEADYDNFLTLVQEIRDRIGADKLISAAFSADTRKLEGFNWEQLELVMDDFNMMSYDFNGGWSNIAGHNSPLYNYEGAEAPNFNWDYLTQWMLDKGIERSKINMGSAFYGRGVVTQDGAVLNGATKKRDVTIQPDGPISTSADYDNWKVEVYDGTPNYFFIKQQETSWTLHWDDEAKVPYMTKGNYFLSYDDEESIGLKAQYINDQALGGTIVWHVAGDQQCLGGTTTYGGKLVECGSLNPTLVNKLNNVFATGCSGCPTVRITSPNIGDVFSPGDDINFSVEASDADGEVTRVDYFNAGTKIGSSDISPFDFRWTEVAEGSYAITALAVDNQGNEKASSKVMVEVNEDHLKPEVTVSKPEAKVIQESLTELLLVARAEFSAGSITSVEFSVDGQLVDTLSSGGPNYQTTWLPSQYGTHQLIVTAQNNLGYQQSSSRDFQIVLCDAAAWDSSLVYTSQEVLYEGKLYQAKWWNQNQRPDTGDAWELVRDCAPDNSGSEPEISIIRPVDGTSVSQGDTIAITADALDSDGAVTQVEFFVAGNLIAASNTSPYQASWTADITDDVTLMVKVTDNAGLTNSSAVAIKVEAGSSSCSLPEWSASDIYTGGESVSYEGQEYQAKWWTTNEVPTASGEWGVWESLGSCQ
ncbi:chitinase [Shewanella psychrophila]|uniref:chitinase n=1 Tax=Shewanella psychrophila TaxID=225848 RepID=A0A1S6HJQ0_9GAMM|nr:glycosyl hydrolase family 18 protein [Shewanella psychrophila]AQS35728.1 chitinase [Shewanella psychrophila]